MRVDINELVLADDPRVVCDTYIFEPSKSEDQLGYMLVAAEVESSDGGGRNLLDLVVQALQAEYYREPRRGALASFESALHQANLVLNDVVDQGQRDWMDSWHVTVAILSNKTLHASTAGNGVMLLARRAKITPLSAGLSHSPITDPLRTFSQVASGTVTTSDVFFLGTSSFDTAFRSEDLTRFVIDHSAATITTRLQQLYEDQRQQSPMAVLVVSLLPEQSTPQVFPSLGDKRSPVTTTSNLQPRKPLVIGRSLFKRLLLLGARLIQYCWRKLKSVIWPAVKKGSQKGGRVLYQASSSAVEQWKSKRPGSGSMSIVPKNMVLMQWQSWPKRLKGLIGKSVRRMPTSSKLFAVAAVVLAVALVVSLMLLQQKRAGDQLIQQASELLHEANTKKGAAETALIYDNRDQARDLLAEATDIVGRVAAMDLYEDQVSELQNEITQVWDRLDKVTRLSVDQLVTIGDFKAVVGVGAVINRLFYLDGNLYSYDATSNAIVSMTEQEGQGRVVSETTQGMGFFNGGVTHEADKTLVLTTDSPGIALYDTKTEVLQKQEIAWPSADPKISSVATYGSRLYMFDQTAGNIYGYNKTLRGYSGGNAWVTDGDFSSETVREIGVDGYVYALHSDGEISKLLKGAPVKFALERLDKPISSEAHLLINEDLKHLYVFDPPNRRVIIFDTTGGLNRQIYLGDESRATDIAVDPEERMLYVLDGTRVLSVSLAE